MLLLLQLLVVLVEPYTLTASLVGGFSGLTSGTWYGLNATAGTITANENYIVGLAISATQIILIKPKGDMSTRDNALYKLQGEKAINDVSATNSGVLAGSSQVLIDKFLNATGQNNTVDTANTTAVYDPILKAYICNQNVILNSDFTSTDNWTYSETDPDYQDYGISGGGRKNWKYRKYRQWVILSNITKYRFF